MAYVRIDIPEDELSPDLIREALAGRMENVPPSAALALLSSQSIPQTKQYTILMEAAEDSSLDMAVRAAAIRSSMRMGIKTAGSGLLKSLQSSEERIAAAAAAALGQIGTPDHLSALKGIREGGDLLKRRVSFAQLLIVHRFGLTDQEIQLPSAKIQRALEVGAQPFISVRPGAERRSRALEGIKRELPQLNPALQDVYEIQCGPRLIEVAVDPRFTKPKLSADLTSRPGLPAIITFQDPEYEEFYPRLIVLIRPTANKRMSLMLTTLTGEPAYVGEGSMSPGGVEFELHATARPGNVAVAAIVRVTTKGLEISGRSDRRSLPGLSPDKAGPA